MPTDDQDAIDAAALKGMHARKTGALIRAAVALGARRAAAARDYLVSLGVAQNRVETVSYGKERPLDARVNEEAWSVNRNAHTNIVSGAVS